MLNTAPHHFQVAGGGNIPHVNKYVPHMPNDIDIFFFECRSRQTGVEVTFKDSVSASVSVCARVCVSSVRVRVRACGYMLTL